MPKKNSFPTVTDQFCGAGGSSIGAKKALEKNGSSADGIKLAMNHWKLAIETHSTNFPKTMHDCTDASAADPRRYPSTDILITSPECTKHSLGAGKKRLKAQMDMFDKGIIDPADERSRATMWDVPRFAEYHDYNIIIVENVVEAREWIMFESWLNAMHALDYLHECVYMNSMHAHPTPQSRDRMYVVFWKKGNKKPNLNHMPLAWCSKCEKSSPSIQSWKNPQKKFGKYRTQYVFRCPVCATQVEPYYYAAFNCIDWSIPGSKIGDRPKPLAENTMRRIEHGYNKYAKNPMVLSENVVCPSSPFIIKLEHSKAENYGFHSMSDSMYTQTTTQSVGAVIPFMVEMNRTGKSRPLTEPTSTFLAGGNHHMLVQPPYMIENFGMSNSRGITDRMGTITTEPKYGVVSHASFNAFMQYYNNGSTVLNGLHEAARTFPTRDRASLVNVQQAACIEDCTYRMLVPHEVQIGMAFDSSYDIKGNSRQKVKQLGNAVTPPVMEWLVDQCLQTLK